MLTDFSPATVNELQRFVEENARGARGRLLPTGGRTSLPVAFGSTRPFAAAADGGAGSDSAIRRGASMEDDRESVRVDLRSLQQVIDYPARDLTITVEAGIRWSELDRMLATERQQVGVDVSLPDRATLGGAIATNTSGPRRFGCGTFRDSVIGIQAIDATGRKFHAGGRVVKNVAGYDLAKPLIGSQGTLAIITQLTLKLRPRPEALGWWWFVFESFAEIENVLERLLTSSARPIVIEQLNPLAARALSDEARLPLPTPSPVLAVAVDGTASAVAAQLETLRKEVVPFGPQQLEAVTGPAAEALLQGLTEYAVSAESPLTFQANLRPSGCWRFAEAAAGLGVPVQCHAGNGVIVGHLPEETASLDDARRCLRALATVAQAAAGNIKILQCDPEWARGLSGVAFAEPGWPWMERLKRQWDPAGIFGSMPFAGG